MTPSPRVRFAPSPTGHLHIGGARTALFNYLYARHTAGHFVLRIEDTDVERSTKEFERSILEDLRWLGLEWDEGPEVGGDFGPYHQSERQGIYREHAEKLLTEGKAYHCYCTPFELEEERKKCLEEGKPPRYQGKCLRLTRSQKSQLQTEGRRPSVRFRVPEGPPLVINDLFRGAVSFEREVIGDFIILKEDGGAVYNFAVVFDDLLMKISHVLRGEEHLSNTPKQLLIAEALKLESPLFGHFSLILGPDRSKLSKRHGAASVGEYKKQGYLPEALFNYLALLGWSSASGEEILSRDEIISQFDVERIGISPSIFDQTKLNWVNGVYIRKMELEKLLPLVRSRLEEQGMSFEARDDQWSAMAVDLCRGHWQTFSQAPQDMAFLFEKSFKLSEEAKQFIVKDKSRSLQILTEFEEGLRSVDILSSDKFKEIEKKIAEKTGLKGKPLFMTLRIIVTGRTLGPELVLVSPLLGKEVCLNRVAKIRVFLEESQTTPNQGTSE